MRIFAVFRLPGYMFHFLGAASAHPRCTREWAGSRAVSCPHELNSCLTSSSEKSWVTAFDGFGRAFRGSTGAELYVELRSASLSTNSENTFSVTCPRFCMSIPRGSWKAIDRNRTSRLTRATASCSNEFKLNRSRGFVRAASITRSKSSYSCLSVTYLQK